MRLFNKFYGTQIKVWHKLICLSNCTELSKWPLWLALGCFFNISNNFKSWNPLLFRKTYRTVSVALKYFTLHPYIFVSKRLSKSRNPLRPIYNLARGDRNIYLSGWFTPLRGVPYYFLKTFGYSFSLFIKMVNWNFNTERRKQN